MFKNIKAPNQVTTTIFVDNESCMKIARNRVYHTRTKNIEVHYHFITEKILSGEVDIHHVTTANQLADIFTKPLGKIKFQNFRHKIGVLSISQAKALSKL